MNDLERRIKSADYTCKTGLTDIDNYDGWNTFYQPYPNTTENLSGYFNMFDYKDKSFLTVGSSGDQAINASMNGSNDITVIDMCPFAKYVYYLKVASILELNFDDYTKHALINYDNMFHHRNPNFELYPKYILEKVLYTLSEIDSESYYFWTYLLDRYPINIITTFFYSSDVERTSRIRQMNGYLSNEELFLKAKKSLENVKPNFIEANLFDYEFDRTFDNINLSNVLQYHNLVSIIRLARKYKEYVSKGGSMMLAYLFDTTEDTKCEDNWEEIFDIPKIKSRLKELDLKVYSFPSIFSIDPILDSQKDEKDSILVYKKEK